MEKYALMMVLVLGQASSFGSQFSVAVNRHPVMTLPAKYNPRLPKISQDSSDEYVFLSDDSAEDSAVHLSHDLEGLALQMYSEAVVKKLKGDSDSPLFYEGGLELPYPLDKEILGSLLARHQITEEQANYIEALYNERLREYKVRHATYSILKMTIRERVAAIAQYEAEQRIKEISNLIDQLKEQRVLAAKNNIAELQKIEARIADLSSNDTQEREYTNAYNAVQKKAAEKYPVADSYNYLLNHRNRRLYDWNDTKTAHTIDEFEGHR